MSMDRVPQHGEPFYVEGHVGPSIQLPPEWITDNLPFASEDLYGIGDVRRHPPEDALEDDE